MKARASIVVVSLALCSCLGSGNGSAPENTGDGGAATGNNSVSGAVSGTTWSTLSRALWVGKPAVDSAPVFIFLFEAPIQCSAITMQNWDKMLGATQSLEIGLTSTDPGVYQVAKGASVAYLLGDVNPDADSGAVTISKVVPGMMLSGSFDVKFGADSLKGTFEAPFCAQGVEP